MKAYYLCTDGCSHYYCVPTELRSKFNEEAEIIELTFDEDDELAEKLVKAFEERYRQYRLGTGPTNFEFYLPD